MTPEELAKSGSEHGHQRAFCAYMARHMPEVWAVTFAIPNGRKRNKIDAGMLKAEGVKAGVPDMMIAWPLQNITGEGWYSGLFLELKKPIVGKVGEAQTPWHERLTAHGYKVVVAYTWEEARDAVLAYFGFKSPGHSQP